MLSVGIIGLPNVGKSTLFNALTRQRAPAANFPFTTIEPNVGVVTVPDKRLETLARLSHSERIVPTTIEFVDIAGLVKGAHRGEGLGNQFLAHIRDVDAIAEVIRFFPDPNVMHVSGDVDPIRDAEIIHTELALSDLQTVDRILEREEREAKNGEPDLTRRVTILRKFHDTLAAGAAAGTVAFDPHEASAVRDLPLLTRTPHLTIANLDERQIRDHQEIIRTFTAQLAARDADVRHTHVIPLCVKIEQELAELSVGERNTFLAEYGLRQSGLDALVGAAYDLLGLQTFFTTGPKETRAWTVRDGATAPEAAGTIHSDFERGFIRAETIPWDRLVHAGSYAAARTQGLVRDEGKDYVIRDGDVFLFKTGF